MVKRKEQIPEYNLTNSFEELDNLISLAEKSIASLEDLKNRRIRTISVASFLFVGLITIVLTIYGKIEIDQLFLIITGLSIFILVLLYEIIKINSKIKTERKIIKKLYNFIGPTKSILSNHISKLNKTTIEMRLSRLNFDY